ncbi:GNAT family N-acetyltransferase [Rathayibacter sp. YIM 133350]|uniref:GNAT family N-acetyltransferase n=1 Tax=Rathayibacter sp. YIM 133350 TaxID=3131992 RepID=UPI00307E727B
MSVQVRPLVDRDFFNWLGLWEGYTEFYASELTDTKALRVWTWLMDKNHDLSGFVAEEDGQLVGLAHVREYPRTLEGDRALFLDDLFVAPDARSHGVGAALIEKAREVARERGLRTVTWITAADNDTAQKLYDQVGARTEWVTYEASA